MKDKLRELLEDVIGRLGPSSGLAIVIDEAHIKTSIKELCGGNELWLGCEVELLMGKFGLDSMRNPVKIIPKGPSEARRINLQDSMVFFELVQSKGLWEVRKGNYSAIPLKTVAFKDLL